MQWKQKPSKKINALFLFSVSEPQTSSWSLQTGQSHSRVIKSFLHARCSACQVYKPLIPAMGVQGKQISLMLRSSQSTNKSMSQTKGTNLYIIWCYLHKERAVLDSSMATWHRLEIFLSDWPVSKTVINVPHWPLFQFSTSGFYLEFPPWLSLMMAVIGACKVK